MAQNSRLVTDSMKYLEAVAGTLRDPKIRSTVQRILAQVDTLEELKQYSIGQGKN